MPATLDPAGLKAGDGFGDFMRFTSDAPPDDGGFSRPVPGESDRAPGADGPSAGQGSADTPTRPIRFTGARSTGRH